MVRIRTLVSAASAAATLSLIGLTVSQPATAAAKHTAAVATTTSTATAPAPAPAPKPLLVGFNEQWDTSGGFDTILSDGDLATAKGLGATALRLPVKCSSVGACTFNGRFDDTTDFSKVTTWDFTKLDSAVSRLLAAGITPIVGPHPGDRMFRPGYIVDDKEFASTQAFVRQIVTHLAAKFGPLPYSFFESELNTSMITDATGVTRYRYMTAAGFPTSFANSLSSLYGGNIASLNSTYGTTYTSFSQVPVPDLGTNLSVPASVYDNPATYDLRRIVGSLSASRYSAIGDLIHQLSPGAEWWGPTIQLQSFDDDREVHTITQLTPVGPTPSDLASQPGIDVLSVDGYRDNDPGLAAAEWRVASKLAARAGKKLAITEIGGQNLSDVGNALDGVVKGASNLRAVLIWEAKDSSLTDQFGTMARDGSIKSGYQARVSTFFTSVASNPAMGTYKSGTEAVYYPEWAMQVVQNGKLTSSKTLRLMADLMANGYSVEPLVDKDVIAGGWTRLSVYSMYMGSDTRAALAASTKPVIAYQYAAHRVGFAAGKAVDVSLWPSRNGFTASGPEATPRSPESIVLLGQSYPLVAGIELNGWPFVHIQSAGNNTVIAMHTVIANFPLAVRNAAGSVWLDTYVGAGPLHSLYG
jgi:hypothetical protein